MGKGEQKAVSCRHARPTVVGASQLQLPRRAHTLAKGRRRDPYKREHVQLGAAWNFHVPAAGFFDEQQEGGHIHELELLATIYALRSFVRRARQRAVQLVTDSKVTEFVV